MNLDRNEDDIVDLLDDNSEASDLFSSSSEKDDDISLPPAHINFKRFLEHVKGHVSAIRQMNYNIYDKVLGTIQLPVLNDESSRLCHHVFCYKCHHQMQIHAGSVIKFLLCRYHGGVVCHEILRDPYCDWANGTQSSNGMCNPHRECCPYYYLNAVTSQVKCSHEGCTAYVHNKCQREWRTKHKYAVPENLPIICRNPKSK
jgi:hypothetical protein